jgi:hypothetical protein
MQTGGKYFVQFPHPGAEHNPTAAVDALEHRAARTEVPGLSRPLPGSG